MHLEFIQNIKKSKQPVGLYVCTATEVWERLGFFLVQSILVLFLLQHLKLSDSSSYALYTAITSLIYASPVIGGFVADKFLGFARSIKFGIILFIFGYLLLCFKQPFFIYLAFALQVVANGFVKGNITGLLGRQYQDKDIRRDSGFTFLYFGINVGQVLGPFLASFVFYDYGFAVTFSLSAISLIFCFLTFYVGKKYLKSESEINLPCCAGLGVVSIYCLAILLVFVIAFLLRYPLLINFSVVVFSLLSFFICFAWRLNCMSSKREIVC